MGFKKSCKSPISTWRKLQTTADPGEIRNLIPRNCSTLILYEKCGLVPLCLGTICMVVLRIRQVLRKIGI